MPLTLKEKKDIGIALTIIIMGSFISLLVVNELFFKWFVITPAYYVLIFVFILVSLFLVSMVAYVGPVMSRAKRAFRVIFHQVPWSFLSFLFALSVFLLFGARAQAAGAEVSPVPIMSILALIIIPALTVGTVLALTSFGRGKNGDDLVGLAVIGVGLATGVMGVLTLAVVLIVLGIATIFLSSLLD